MRKNANTLQMLMIIIIPLSLTPTQDLGEVLFGLSYLPTAQRLSVSVIKAQNLRYENVCSDVKDFCEYILLGVTIY